MSLALRNRFTVSTLIALGIAALFAGGCSSLPPDNGPTVGVRNDSDAPLRATFWIGNRNEQYPGAPADMSAQRTLSIAPYGTTQYKLNAYSGFESTAASFVRVQIEPVGTSFQSTPQHWFELNPPTPFTVRVHGQKPNLKFERVGGGTMVAVPNNLLFHNAPATASANKAPLKVAGNPNSATTAAPARKLNTNRPLTEWSVAKPAPTKVTGVPDRNTYPND